MYCNKSPNRLITAIQIAPIVKTAISTETLKIIVGKAPVSWIENRFFLTYVSQDLCSHDRETMTVQYMTFVKSQLIIFVDFFENYFHTQIFIVFPSKITIFSHLLRSQPKFTQEKYVNTAEPKDCVIINNKIFKNLRFVVQK